VLPILVSLRFWLKGEKGKGIDVRGRGQRAGRERRKDKEGNCYFSQLARLASIVGLSRRDLHQMLNALQLQMQVHVDKCSECLVKNLQEKAKKNEIFDFKE